MSRWIRPFAVLALLAALTACSPSDPAPGPAPSDSAAPAGDGHLRPKFRMPSNFGTSSAVALPMVVADDFEAQIIAMKDVDTIEAVMVVSYILPQDFTGASDADLKAKIAEYDAAAGATPTSDTLLAIASRHKGFVQSLEQEVDGRTISYESTYLFFGPKMVQVMCQWDEQRDKVDRACGVVLRTLDITGV